MLNTVVANVIVLALAVAPSPSGVHPTRPSLEALERAIETREPETRVKRVDHERITARRIDLVDENGVIRLTLAAPAPNPIVDGIQYKRAFPVSGITIFDRNGSERGGIGVADIDGTAAVLALDHINSDAIGWRIMPDGSVSFQMNQRPEIVREPGLDNHIVPGVQTSSRIQMSVAADGAPAIVLADGTDRPRLRLTVTQEGYGVIEFLDAAGKIAHSIAPERDVATGNGRKNHAREEEARFHHPVAHLASTGTLDDSAHCSRDFK